MGLYDPHDEKVAPRKRLTARKAPKRAARKPLHKMSRAELDAMPEKEFLARLSPKVRKAVLAAQKLKGLL